MAFGQPVNTYYDLSKANDDRFARFGFPGLRRRPACATRGSSPRGRRVRGDQTAMNRLYVVEPMPTPTGAKADHRLPLRAGDIEVFAGALATAVGTGRGPASGRERRHL